MAKNFKQNKFFEKRLCLKTVGNVFSFSFASFLVFNFHKLPIKLSGFDRLYLKNFFEFR